MNDISPVLDLAGRLVAQGRKAGIRVATAESCTGGMVGAALTEIDGASAIYDRGFVTYTNDSKVEMLGVPPELIAAHGAVSSQVAVAMAEGALLRSATQIAVSVTGIAGPRGGTADKPVGLVHFAVAIQGAKTLSSARSFPNSGRFFIRLAACAHALELISNAIESFSGMEISDP